ncbi:unnamed protein product [Trichobilharzia szidati]|nr:unnamed protein product [Trichobilharzia szidati]
MAGDNTEIDLYDNIDEDFVQECTDLTELYDDVITPIKSENTNIAASTLSNKQSHNSSNHSGRRVSVYVGNLTWWTTDLDLLEAAAGIGINDVIEVKFHENRQNGQSKGFCVMVFGSEQSMRIAMDKFPKVDLHGQNPVVTSFTKHNLSVFEKAAGGDNQATARPRTEEVQNAKVSTAGTTGVLGNRLPTPLMATPTMPASLGFSVRNNSPLMGQVVPNIRNAANLSSTIQQALINHNVQSNLNANSSMGQLPLNFPGSTNVLMPPSGISSAAFSANAAGLLPSNFTLPSTIPTSLSATNAHINPSFLTHSLPGNTSILQTPVPPSGVMQMNTHNNDSNARPQFDHYGRPVIHTYTPQAVVADVVVRTAIVIAMLAKVTTVVLSSGAIVPVHDVTETDHIGLDLVNDMIVTNVADTRVTEGPAVAVPTTVWDQIYHFLVVQVYLESN